MKTIYAIGFSTPSLNDMLFYCFDSNIGAYLSKDVNQAYKFMSLESARRDAPNLMKYFWAYPISYTILKGTKK